MGDGYPSMFHRESCHAGRHLSDKNHRIVVCDDGLWCTCSTYEIPSEPKMICIKQIKPELNSGDNQAVVPCDCGRVINQAKICPAE